MSQHIKDVICALERLSEPPEIHLINEQSLGLPEKGDIEEFLQEHKPEAIKEVMANAPIKGSTFAKKYEETCDGLHQPMDFPWPELSRTQALLPQTLTTICGLAGASKTLMALQLALHLFQEGVPFGFCEVEGARFNMELRLLAMLSGDSRVCNRKWLKHNRAVAMTMMKEHQRTIDDFGKSLYAEETRGITHKRVLEWCSEEIKAGKKLLVIDPCTAITYTTARNTYLEEKQFVDDVQNLAVSKDVNIILVTHPTKSVQVSTQGAVANSASFTRFPKALLWLETHSDKESVVKCRDTGERTVFHNRTIFIEKANNGPLTGKRIAYKFDEQTFLLEELGVIKPKK